MPISWHETDVYLAPKYQPIFFLCSLIYFSTMWLGTDEYFGWSRAIFAVFSYVALCRAHIKDCTNEMKVDKDTCHMFTVGFSDSKEFYSPVYTKSYPNCTDCTRLLKADVGYQVKLEFRDYFELENSSGCKNDFLEIRDGQYGYSNLLHKFCGRQTSLSPIISKDRYLWLRFKSDETIEARGFKGVYEFIKAPNNTARGVDCEFELTGHQGSIQYSDTEEKRNESKTFLECVWKVEVSSGKRIYTFFQNYDLSFPNDCEKNYIDVFDGKRDFTSNLTRFCGAIADTIETKTNVMYFRYFTGNISAKANFKAWFTAFREKSEKGPNSTCTPNEFDCQDARCIDMSLRCNELKNCRHEYDEENCSEEDKKKFDISAEHIVVILTLGCGLLAGMCCAMCFNCVKKLVRDGRQIHENIRRSREQLEERRSASLASSPRTTHRVPVLTEDGPCFMEGKSNGHTCVHTADEEEDTEEVEEEDEEVDEEDDLDEPCVEMKDCECQTRDSLLMQRDSIGAHGTPPPPPPPTRRPPGAPPLSPLIVPTPPPPPTSHYGRPPHPKDFRPYTSGDHLERSNKADPYKERYRAEAVIQMRDRVRYEPTKTEKTKPDVLVTH